MSGNTQSTVSHSRFTAHNSRLIKNVQGKMALIDINKTLTQTGDSFKQLSVLNPLTIRKKGTRAKAVFALSLVCFLWGTTWLASKQGVRHMPALQLAGIR